MFKEIAIYYSSLNKIQTPFLTFTSVLLKLLSRFLFYPLQSFHMGMFLWHSSESW